MNIRSSSILFSFSSLEKNCVVILSSDNLRWRVNFLIELRRFLIWMIVSYVLCWLSEFYLFWLSEFLKVSKSYEDFFMIKSEMINAVYIFCSKPLDIDKIPHLEKLHGNSVIIFPSKYESFHAYSFWMVEFYLIKQFMASIFRLNRMSKSISTLIISFNSFPIYD